MTKEKIIIICSTLVAVSSLAAAGYLFVDSKKKDSEIASLLGKEQQCEAVAQKAKETRSANEEVIAELRSELERLSSERAGFERDIKSFALQAASCEALKSKLKKR
jgi:uncharacterized protein involved in exopolysaccharide biosynthesis